MSTEQFFVVGLDVVRRFADNPPNLSAFLDDGAVGHLQAVLPGPPLLRGVDVVQHRHQPRTTRYR